MIHYTKLLLLVGVKTYFFKFYVENAYVLYIRYSQVHLVDVR